MAISHQKHFSGGEVFRHSYPVPIFPFLFTSSARWTCALNEFVSGRELTPNLFGFDVHFCQDRKLTNTPYRCATEIRKSEYQLSNFGIMNIDTVRRWQKQKTSLCIAKLIVKKARVYLRRFEIIWAKFMARISRRKVCQCSVVKRLFFPGEYQ